MKKTLLEDDCLRDGLDFNQELSNLLSIGYIIISKQEHPAVGRIYSLVKRL